MDKVKEYSKNLKDYFIETSNIDVIDPATLSVILNATRSLEKNSDSGKVWDLCLDRPILLHPKHKAISEIEIFFKILAKGQNKLKILDYQIEMKLWSDKRKYAYRYDWDSVYVRDYFDIYGKRVLARYHFDIKKKEAEIAEPFYHFHAGGRHTHREICWVPKQLAEPRFPLPPFDLILFFEFVFLNFFRRETEDFRKKPEWVNVVRNSQNIFQRGYFENCLKFLDEPTNTLLGHSTLFKFSDEDN